MEARDAGAAVVGTPVDDGRTRLTPDDVGDYLCERGLLAPGARPQVSELSGGISNCVIRVRAAGTDLVVKQSLPRLRVREVWEFDPRRILTEARCMQVLGEIMAPGTVPEVRDIDERRLAFTMTCAPPGGVVWKDELLNGRVDLPVADRAGALLGRLHRASAHRPGLAAEFDDLMPIVQGRIDPYHRTAALVHPDLGAEIEADVQRLLTHRRALVLGDYSPKNLIVYPDRVLALDFEVAHWGDPAFDAAFMLVHLIAKAVHLPEHGETLLAAARRFWAAYDGHAGADGARSLDTATECAVLLLCRVDGKSRLEYLGEEQARVIRELARAQIRGPRVPIDELLDTIDRELS